ncbi:MAG: metallopeptidase TldD-related protein [Bacteriovoracaceae bacterium]
MGLFWHFFRQRCDGEKSNPFADKLDSKVAVSDLTIKDCPRYKSAFFHYDYDGEGVPTTDLTLIENGVLKSFYHNSVTARFFKTKSTGHASRSPKSALGVNGTIKVISAGKVNETDTLKGTYLELYSLDGLHSGANAVSGDFFIGASGYLCENGKRVKPVNGITVAGNFFEALKKIGAIGDHGNGS